MLGNVKIPSLKVASIKNVVLKGSGASGIKIPKVSAGKISASPSRPARIVTKSGAGIP